MAPNEDQADNTYLQNFLQAFSSEANYFFGGTEEVLARVSPEWRGPLDANGRPTATAMADAAAAHVKDKELSDAPTTFRIEIGSKRIPEVEIAQGELTYHNKMTQGVEALREGFSSPASFSVGKRIYSLNLEKYVAGLAEAGLSTRGSEQI